MGKIMLNGVTYSGTIYEASDEGSGTQSLSATRVTYNDTYTGLDAANAQYAIEKLKQLNDNLSEKMPFSLMYNKETKEYGYIDNDGKFVNFITESEVKGDSIEVFPKGNGTSPIAQIKINDDYYTILGYGDGLILKENCITEDNELPDINISTEETKNWLTFSQKDAAYTYKIIESDDDEGEDYSIIANKGDAIYSDGLDWKILFKGAKEIDKDFLYSYTSLITGCGKKVGTLQAENASYDILVPAYTDNSISEIKFGKNSSGNYGYYKDKTFTPFSVSITNLLENGTDIATITVDNTSYTIKSPSITGVKFEKVASYSDLPTVGEEGTIYLVLKEATSINNIYTEYIWVVNDEVGVYEMLGDTAVKAIDIEVSAEYQSGTKVASISIDDEDTDIYIPQWTGTQAEYEAQKNNIDDGTIVNITDDEVPQGEYKNLDTRVTELEKNALCRKKYISLQPGASGTFQLESPKVYLFVNAHVNWAHSREIYMLINYQPYGFISQYIGGNTNCLNFSYNTDTNLVTVSNTYSDEGVRGILIELGKTS